MSQLWRGITSRLTTNRKEFDSAINELDKHGILFDKTIDHGIIFNCKTHPYQEETIPASTRQELFNKLGNIHCYNADNKKLTIRKVDLSSSKEN